MSDTWETRVLVRIAYKSYPHNTNMAKKWASRKLLDLVQGRTNAKTIKQMTGVLHVELDFFLFYKDYIGQPLRILHLSKTTSKESMAWISDSPEFILDKAFKNESYSFFKMWRCRYNIMVRNTSQALSVNLYDLWYEILLPPLSLPLP